eukprot:14022096-Alexandrium_andersonii.AAC.1
MPTAASARRRWRGTMAGSVGARPCAWTSTRPPNPRGEVIASLIGDCCARPALGSAMAYGCQPQPALGDNGEAPRWQEVNDHPHLVERMGILRVPRGTIRFLR